MTVASKHANVPVNSDDDKDDHDLQKSDSPPLRSAECKHYKQKVAALDSHLRPTDSAAKAHSIEEDAEPETQDLQQEMDWSCLNNGKLYGRQQEVSQLRQAFYRRLSITKPDFATITEGELKTETEASPSPTSNLSSELIIVSGKSGTGKTALVQTALKDLAAAQGGFFVMGKFDQLQIPDPHAPFVAALTDLLLMLEAKAQQGGGEEENKLAATRKKLLTEVDGMDGMEVCNVLRALIPSLARIFDLGPQEGGNLTSFSWTVGRKLRQDRLKIALRKFFSSVCSKSQPLVFVMDDLQWADSGFFDLLESIVSGSEKSFIEGLIVVGICRSEEVSFEHDLASMLRHLEEDKGTCITHMKLTSLPMEATSELLSDVMQQPQETCQELTQIIHDKTNGNVFFILQFLKALCEEGVLVAKKRTTITTTKDGQQQQPQQQWVWHEENWDHYFHIMKEFGVVELLSRHLQKLAQPCQSLLRTAAFIGAEFEVDVLCALLELEEVALVKVLQQMAKKGFLLQRRNQPGKYAFSHDQIQKAAYSLVPKDERAILHLSIGRTLYQHLSSDKSREKIFPVVNQMFRGAELLQLESDKYGLANLCWKAGNQATVSSDFKTAITYYDMGIGLLAQRHWRDEYQLSLELYNSLAEAACCVAHFDRVDRAINDILANARSYNDKIRAYTTKIYSLAARLQMKAALDLGREVLANLGEKIPAKPGVIHFLLELYRVKRQLRGKSTSELLNLPDIDIENHRKLAAMTIMSMMSVYAFMAEPELFPHLCLKMVSLSLKHGLSAISTQGFVIYGALLVALDDVDQGYQYGMLALEILNRYKRARAEWLPRTYANIYGVIAPWKMPISPSLGPLLKAHAVGMETGDLEFSMIAGYLRCQIAYLSGLSLKKIEEDLVVYVDLCAQCKQEMWMVMTGLQLQLVRNLMGKSTNPLMITCELDFSLVGGGGLTKSSQAVYTCLAMLYGLVLSYHFDDLPLALETAKHCGISEKLIKPAPGVFFYRFYDGMVALKAARTIKKKKRKNIRQGRQAITKLEKMAHHCPENNMHKLSLLKAELMDLQGNTTKAVDLYSKAIHHAVEQGVLEVEALACECFGLALERWGDKSSANEYLKRAVEKYEEWGASGLASFKQKQYKLQ